MPLAGDNADYWKRSRPGHYYAGVLNRFLKLFALGQTVCVCACATTANNAVCEPTALSVAPKQPLVCETYAPDSQRVARLRTIQASGTPPPEANALSLAQELVTLLADPDPEVRDGLAFELLYTWIKQQHLLDGPSLSALGTQLLPALRVRSIGTAGPSADPCVFGRSFAALALSLIAARDIDEGFLSAAELHGHVEAALRYASEEHDLRGYTGEGGWAHAAAHTADWMFALARNPRLSADDAQSLLSSVAQFVLRPHGFVLHHGEDGRLAQPVLALLRRDALPASVIDTWLEQYLEPFREPMSGDPMQPLYARQRNARNMLFTLFVSLSLEESPSATAQSALAAVRKVLEAS